MSSVGVGLFSSPDPKVLIGFAVSMIYVFIDQSMDYIKDGKFLDQFLDFTVHAIGSSISAYIGYRIIKK